MFLTASHAERLLNEMRKDPLQAGEIRRVKGLGHLYMALSTTPVDSTEYTRVYTMFIDDIEYTFYNKLAGRSREAAA